MLALQCAMCIFHTILFFGIKNIDFYQIKQGTIIFLKCHKITLNRSYKK